MQQRPGAAHAVWAFWTGPDRTFSHWYVNFQDPFVRSVDGFDTFDHELDLVVMPDGSYHWKDVAEFEQMVADGKFSDAEAEAVRDEAAEVVSALDRGERWWDESWVAWKPPPS
jgi:protein associated with RNAse G/E